MTFKEIENKLLSVSKIKMNADKVLQDKQGRSVPYPLIKTSGFAIQISGASRSGKTTLLINLISKRASKGHRQSYKSLFDDILVVSPSRHTLATDVFEDICESKKFDSLDDETFEKINELAEDNKENDTHTLVILDDIASFLKDAGVEKQLVNLVNNRRHKSISIIFITQIFNQAPPALRKNLDMLMLFRPKTKNESESLIKDYFMIAKDKVLELFKFVYRTPHDFMIIDFTQRQSSNFEYFRNYNKIQQDE